MSGPGPESGDAVRALLHPRSVAIFGASDDTAKWGGSILALLRKFGFPGRIHPINPRSAEVQGLRAWPSARAVGEPIDVAVLAVPHDRAVAAFEDCAAAGVRAILMVTAQFAEAGDEGRALQDRLVAIARSGGMRIIGPNCMGYFNAHADLCLLNAQALIRNPRLLRGDVAMISQSGALAGAMLARAYDLGVGFSFCVSLGNQADLEVCDFLEYAIADPGTRVIASYVEGLKDPQRFVAALRAARDAGKPVLLLKAGRTEVGQQAVQSHTASLAGSHAAFAATARHAGALLVDDFFDLVTQAIAFSTLPAPREGGVAVFSGSGGGAAVSTDLLDEAGLVPGALSEATVDACERLMPRHGAHLPFDLGATPASYRTEHWLRDVMATMMADPGIGAGIYVMTTQPDMAGAGRAVIEVGRSAGKPLLFVNAASSCGVEAVEAVREAGVVRFESVRDAARCLALRTGHERARALHDDAAIGPAPEALEAIAGTLPEGLVSEHDAKRLLAAAGLPVTRGEVAATADDAVRIAQAIGYPVAMKIVSAQISHKSDVGGVALDVRDAAAVRERFGALAQAVGRVPGARFEGCLVQSMAGADVELLVGTCRDAQFGPMLMFGFGGTLVELHRDTALLPAGAGPRAIAEALSRLRQYPLLTGYRGRSKVDLPRLVAVIGRMGALAVQLGERLVECEANPVMVRGESIVVADARAVWRRG